MKTLEPQRCETEAHKLTPKWGEEQAQRLFAGTLARFEVAWKGAVTLDFGCSWGYLAKYILERLGASQSYGVDIHPHWDALAPDWRPENTPGLTLLAGDVSALPALQPLQFDVICSMGTMMLIRPTRLSQDLEWFYDHLRPGGHCIFRTRTFPSYCGGDLHQVLKSPLPHLLFSRRTIDRYLTEKGIEPSRYMSPLCAASYLMLFRAAGFEILEAIRVRNPIDQEIYERFADKLGVYDAQELQTSDLIVLLRKAETPVDFSVLERGE